MSEQPSAAALVIATLVPALTDETCSQLRALLADDLATAEVLAPSQHRLVGIAALIDALGRVPSIAEYERARSDHAEWPHPSMLGRAYGSWLAAVRAAVKMTSEPPRPPGPRRRSTLKHARADCVNAIVRCAQALGDWPASSEYQRWQVVEADLCRRAGTHARTPPTLRVVTNRLGTWKAALDAARAIAPPGLEPDVAQHRFAP